MNPNRLPSIHQTLSNPVVGKAVPIVNTLPTLPQTPVTLNPAQMNQAISSSTSKTPGGQIYSYSINSGVGVVRHVMGGRVLPYISYYQPPPNQPQSLPFNPEEDTRLCFTVLEIGEENWGRVSLSMRTRTPFECWERWNIVKKRYYNDIFSSDKELSEKASKLPSFRQYYNTEDDNTQKICCIENCKNAVQNRSRFSLRAQYNLKEDFMGKNWNKICTKHYFADLYKFKKKTRRKRVSSRPSKPLPTNGGKGNGKISPQNGNAKI